MSTGVVQVIFTHSGDVVDALVRDLVSSGLVTGGDPDDLAEVADESG